MVLSELRLYLFWFWPELMIVKIPFRTKANIDIILHSGKVLCIGCLVLGMGSVAEDWRVFNNVATVRHHIMLVASWETQVSMPDFIDCFGR